MCRDKIIKKNNLKFLQTNDVSMGRYLKFNNALEYSPKGNFVNLHREAIFVNSNPLRGFLQGIYRSNLRWFTDICSAVDLIVFFKEGGQRITYLYVKKKIRGRWRTHQLWIRKSCYLNAVLKAVNEGCR